MYKIDLDTLSEFSNTGGKEIDVNCFYCGKPMKTRTVYKNIACYKCLDCMEKEWNANPPIRKDFVLSKDAIRILDEIKNAVNEHKKPKELKDEILKILAFYDSEMKFNEPGFYSDKEMLYGTN